MNLKSFKWDIKDMCVNLQKVNGKFSLKTIAHLNQCMIWFVSEKFNPNNVPIYWEQIKQLIFIYCLQEKVRCEWGALTFKFYIANHSKAYETYEQSLDPYTPWIYLAYREKYRHKLTSGFRLDTRTVHLSFVPLIPGGRPPPKAAAIAAALPNYSSSNKKR